MKKVLVVIVGVIFVGTGIFVLVSENAKAKRCTEETVGTVVAVTEKWSIDSDGNDEYIYYPVIRYQAGNRTITKQSSSGSSSNSRISSGAVSFSSSHSKYSVNDSIDILYNPNDVEEFIIKGDRSSSILGGIVFIVVGSLAAILGIIKPVY